MTRTDSDTSLVSTNSCPIQLENSQIVLHDEDENSNVLSIDEYCPNREVVNLENAAVNIDNSTDVIIGPVTQLNVSGNVTIYSNGNAASETANGTVPIKEQESKINLRNGAKLEKCEKSDSEQDLKNLSKHKKVIRIFVLISFALLVTIGIVVLILHYTNNVFSDNTNFTTHSPGQDDDNNLGSHQIIDKKDWHGRPAIDQKEMASPVSMVIIKHTGGGICSSFATCAGKVQSIQSDCVARGYDDIIYSFLIGGDGNVYVGRGWNTQPAQINNTIDIAFIGSFTFDILTDTMIEAAQLLLDHGVELNKLTENYRLVAHNQTMSTESPGKNVYKNIINWPHYDARITFGETLMKLNQTQTD